MSKESTKRCSHCGHNGHNSRTCKRCSGSGFKLFGVQIDVSKNNDSGDSRIRKSKSLGNLEGLNLQGFNGESVGVEASGYLSDDIVHQSSKGHERKRGTPWSEEEHRSFLAGLEKLGKGDWKGISKNFVPTRNSSQVASHAQKYFIRKAASEKKHRRASVFDIPLTEPNQPLPGGSGSVTKAVESPEQASSSAAVKNIGELKGLASIQAPITTIERPPIPPMMRRGIPNYGFAYMPRAPGFAQFPAPAVMPTVSWVPVMNIPNRGSFLLPNIRPNIAACMPQPAVARLAKVPSSQPGSATVATNKDELNLSIRNLAL